MFTQAHTDHLRAQLQGSQKETAGWQELVAYAQPRMPHAVVDNLRYQLAAAAECADGWHLLLELAVGVTAPKVDEMRLNGSMPPCTCGYPGLLGMTHRNDGRPCLEIHMPGPAAVVDDPGATSVLPEVPGEPREYANPYPQGAPSEAAPFPAGSSAGVDMGGPLSARRDKVVDVVVAEHLVQDHVEALKDDAKWERKHR